MEPEERAAARGLTRESVARAAYDAIRECAVTLRPDVRDAVARARDAAEPGSRAAGVLGRILANADVAAADGVPLCQDTGSTWVCLEVGEELSVPGDVLAGVDDAVARAYRDGALRMSLLRDALLDRANTGDNTPAFSELRLVPGRGATLHVMLKGGGSDNASRVVMLAPGEGVEGVRRVVLDCVREKAANACPPLIVGVGVGGTFDRVASLAKHALLRPVGAPAASPETAALEAGLLDAVNALGIGPAALGGAATALAVHLETAPCHIAALPVAVNMGCCAMRSKSVELVPRGEDGDADGAAARSAGGADGAAADNSAPEATGGEPDRGPVRLMLPLSREDAARLEAGDEVLLTGPVYTMRDAGHARALAALDEAGALPFGLEGATLFYAGPTPAAAGRPLGSVGPTTASRMDFATPRLLEAGIVAAIGKGKRSPEVVEACRATGGVYLCAVGGIAALLAKAVASSEVVAWDDLGTEALRRLELVDFPAYVAVDARGRDLYREVESAATA
ncbi:fumarate hydratase [Adlercreutzia faecimuris]|uniref:Fumarate hydratase n=1 Tax=Adlercreutzia faecimuris TaxID=2897341 RepID=A0ABS9WGA0_9ACTN|nr:fumarate hydratase [Adlercreutzia sp. JBNU-10]MCI2241805.1 fumarate hydratase [Adlercreutzia sp. JBNU-10]